MICFDLVWSIVCLFFFFLLSWFLCCCVSVGVLHLINALIFKCKAGHKARALEKGTRAGRKTAASN